MVRENFQDAVMVNTLARLQHAQITMTEKLNNIFVQSINKGSSRAHHQQAAGAAAALKAQDAGSSAQQKNKPSTNPNTSTQSSAKLGGAGSAK